MKRVEKPEGKYNIVVNEVEIPECGETEVLIEANHSLISRGSELWRRYQREEAIDHERMGYSLAGEIVEVGEKVESFCLGDVVAASAPHAAYVTREVVDQPRSPRVVSLPNGVDTEIGTFWPLSTSSVRWIKECDPDPGDAVVVQGQGLVGSGCMQVLLADTEAHVVAVDALDIRCALARDLGAHEVINVSEEDPVEAVTAILDGKADIVIEAVGGPAGAKAFRQAQEMVRHGGLIQVIGLYEDEPLPLDSSAIQGRRLVGGFVDRSTEARRSGSDRALELLASGEIDFANMITDRFPATEAATAFDYLYEDPEEALGVILDWTDV